MYLTYELNVNSIVLIDLCSIEQTIVATAVSDIAAGVHATGSLTWITTSYLLTTTVIQPITGRLSVRAVLLCSIQKLNQNSSAGCIWNEELAYC